jgi:hypothetical protein
MKEDPFEQAITHYKKLQQTWTIYDERKKQETVTFYFGIAMSEYRKASEMFPVVRSKKVGVIKTPIYVSVINNMVFNFYMFLLIYSDMSGSWEKFNNEIKLLSFLLWDSKMGNIAYKLFTPILDNQDWEDKYLEGSSKRMINNEYHKRAVNKSELRRNLNLGIKRGSKSGVKRGPYKKK